MPVNNNSPRIAVEEETKREISIIAAHEGRKEYEIVRDALELYKAVLKKPARSKKVIKPVPIAEVISQ